MNSNNIEKVYGFIDEDNLLIDTFVAVEDDIETLERLKDFSGAVEYHIIDLDKTLVIKHQTFWNGKTFVPPSPFKSWVWNEDSEQWEAPFIADISTAPGPGYWVWNEDIINWDFVATDENIE